MEADGSVFQSEFDTCVRNFIIWTHMLRASQTKPIMSGLLVVLIRINPKGPHSIATFELLSNATIVKVFIVFMILFIS